MQVARREHLEFRVLSTAHATQAPKLPGLHGLKIRNHGEGADDIGQLDVVERHADRFALIACLPRRGRGRRASRPGNPAQRTGPDGHACRADRGERLFQRRVLEVHAEPPLHAFLDDEALGCQIVEHVEGMRQIDLTEMQRDGAVLRTGGGCQSEAGGQAEDGGTMKRKGHRMRTAVMTRPAVIKEYERRLARQAQRRMSAGWKPAKRCATTRSIHTEANKNGMHRTAPDAGTSQGGVSMNGGIQAA